MSAARSRETKQRFSLIFLTINSQADFPPYSQIPSIIKSLTRWSVIALPETKLFLTACGIEKPSNTGTIWVTSSPESQTIPINLPFE